MRVLLASTGGAIAAIAVALAGCAQTSQVAGNVDAATLSHDRKAIVLMKVGSAEAICHSVRVVLAKAEGSHYREVRTLTVVAPRKLDEPTVAEAELEPGAYHVVAYACATAKRELTIASRREGGLFDSSLASFALAPGEIVNVGYLRLMPVRRQAHFGAHYAATLAVVDWPLAEFERYKAARPQLYAAMQTRLMTMTPQGAPSAENCDTARRLQAEHKMEHLPRDCATPPPAAGAPAKPPRSTATREQGA